MLLGIFASCAILANGLALFSGEKGGSGRAAPDILGEKTHSFKQNSVSGPQGSVRQTQRGDQQDILFVDAGSSGSKIFSFTPEKTLTKLYTECRANLTSTGSSLHGVAALSHDEASCDWEIGSSLSHLHPLGEASRYASVLLQLLAATYKAASGKTDMSDVMESQAVPILATAGMRLISQAANERVWSLICNKSGSGLAFASRGNSCGTISGTTEAYYEFLANAANGRSRALTGTFTVGGASSQISIPLKTEEEVASFKKMRSDLYAELNCTALTLEDGQRAPIFNEKREGGEEKECLEDYISFRPASEIRATTSVLQDNVRIGDIQGVGVVSFLGLEGRGTFVAGGVVQIGRWAEQVGCTASNSSFQDCHEKLRQALAGDVMWKHVTAYFRANALDINDFSYNTFAAMPEAAGLEGVSGRDQGWELEQELKEKCAADNSVRFGYKNSNSCMKALFTSLYVTSFFADPASSSAETPGHNASELHFDPKRDWAEGVREEIEAGSSLLQESSLLAVHSLLRVRLPRAAFSYVDGARLHLGR